MKYEDLTLKQIKEICNKHQNCSICPIDDLCYYTVRNPFDAPEKWEDSVLKEEID